VAGNMRGVHHVVFCVRAENQDAAAKFWVDLGCEFVDIRLDELGLRVLLDWDQGIELISPTGPAGVEFQTFLDLKGEGVYSVVVRTEDIAGPVSVAGLHGVSVEYQQHRADGTYELDEARLAPFYGMPITFLATERP
jgi:methylmalonyl-CoA/ethylmalonyl-CoA epimerase